MSLLLLLNGAGGVQLVLSVGPVIRAVEELRPDVGNVEEMIAQAPSIEELLPGIGNVEEMIPQPDSIEQSLPDIESAEEI